jgi:putative transposase
MEVMGIEAVYLRPRLSQPGEGHKIYLYLLRGVEVARVNRVWSTDIYIYQEPISGKPMWPRRSV